jgi:hypothetical protein
LKKIGDKIVHAAAFSEPKLNLAGSFFKNGEITLEFKGLSRVNGKSCALIGYDSGESSFKMVVNPIPELNQTLAARIISVTFTGTRQAAGCRKQR